MKILAGIEQPTSGSILIDARPVRIDSVPTALASRHRPDPPGTSLSDSLDIAANLFLGREPRRWSLIDRRQIASRARELLARVGLQAEPHTLVRDLTIGQRQLVEIARALSVNARVIIMDEPTSSLSQQESDRLFEVVRELREGGVSIIYISHRLVEIEQLADRAVVLRDGRKVDELPRAEITHDRLVERMVGRQLSRFYVRGEHQLGAVALEVSRLVTRAWPRHGIDFQVRGGEIVGLAGLVGAGRSELLRAIFGVDPPLAGRVLVNGQTLCGGSPRKAIDARRTVPGSSARGLVLQSSVAENIGLAGLRRFRYWGCFANGRRQASVRGG